MSIDNRQDDLPQWSSFWRQGYITTFGSSKVNNYDGVVLQFWRDKFRELEDGARVLDIATGNGAVATIAAEVSEEYEKRFSIAATDIAHINSEIVGDSAAGRLRDGIDFRSSTPCERQPFEDDSIELVTSQFGFEYSDVPATLKEIRRILVPGGQFIAISHHADSDLIKAAASELEIYRFALSELNLFAGVRDLFISYGDLNRSPETVARAMKSAKPLSTAINGAVNELLRRYPDEECAREIVDAVSHLASGAKSVTQDERNRAVTAAAADFAFANARLQDMVEAALTAEQIENFSVEARESGFRSAHCLKLYAGANSLSGWQIHLK